LLVAKVEVKPEDIEILRQYTYTVRPTLEEEVTYTAIIYRYKDRIVGSVSIPKKEPTDEEIFEAVREDVLRRLAAPPRRLRV